MFFLARWISTGLLWPLSLFVRLLSLVGHRLGITTATRCEDTKSSQNSLEGGVDPASAPQEVAADLGATNYAVIESKGETISGGASGIVERLPSGDVIKSPWPGSRAADCRRDMIIEAQIYARLGTHPRLVKTINWNPDECSLTMEYMPNGSLKDYILANNDKISTSQRLRWSLEAAEGLQLLHSAKVLHCDVEPKNFLLDADLGLRIADFSGSSFESVPASACAGTRFLPPTYNPRHPPTVQNDFYGLGSTIYSIMTGQYPFQELPSNEVEELYKAHVFPNVRGIPCGEIIERCWRGEFFSAQEICDLIQVEILAYDDLESY